MLNRALPSPAPLCGSWRQQSVPLPHHFLQLSATRWELVVKWVFSLQPSVRVRLYSVSVRRKAAASLDDICWTMRVFLVHCFPSAAAAQQHEGVEFWMSGDKIWDEALTHHFEHSNLNAGLDGNRSGLKEQIQQLQSPVVVFNLSDSLAACACGHGTFQISGFTSVIAKS